MLLDLLGLSAQFGQVGVGGVQRGLDLGQSAGGVIRAQKVEGGRRGREIGRIQAQARQRHVLTVQRDRLGRPDIGQEVQRRRAGSVQNVLAVKGGVLGKGPERLQQRLELVIVGLARRRGRRRVSRRRGLLAQLDQQVGDLCASGQRHVRQRRGAVHAGLDGLKRARVGALVLGDSPGCGVVLGALHLQAGVHTALGQGQLVVRRIEILERYKR
ncbi:hypothetical protein D3C86_1317870 [compost metagenome]